ncbi:hypothetical protein MHYMCMPSP_00800 [Hyalomma marginatum]|uniref:Transposase n=1 Tax=Hyalomma marginatum TaxID=34627 RepID=A0A8S4BVY2_9ACAR|nr:hypothetical protein MHYMCMPSP_00800 [Hyalomma marginatum]CAG7597468.1 hypothetical protein MHYMCMPASI_00940 [Hyalomma marginatum]
MDKELGYIYLRSFLWYTNTKVSKRLERIIEKHLSIEEREQ